jgi:hypothetical protein
VVSIAQYGVADAVVGNALGMLAVRFDPPFNVPYTITGISFPSRTQFQIPATLGRFTSIRIQGLDAGDAGPGTLWTKQRSILCSADNTTTLTHMVACPPPPGTFCVGGDFTADGVHVGDRLVGPKVAANTLVTSVGTTSVTLDKPVPSAVTVTTTSFVPAPRVINSSSDIPAPRAVNCSSDIPLPRVVSCGPVIPAPRVANMFCRILPPSIYADTLFLSSGSLSAVLVGDVVTGPAAIPAGTTVVQVQATTTPTIPVAFVRVSQAIILPFGTPDAITFTTPSTTRLARSAGSFVTDGVRVGDVVTGTNIPAGTSVTAVAATAVTVNQVFVSSFTTSATFTTPPPTVLLRRASGSFVTDGVRIGDVVTGVDIPPNTKVVAVAAATVTLNQNLFTSFTETVTFTTPQTFTLKRASGSYITDDVRVGDVASGANIAVGTRVVTVAAASVTVDQPITVAFTEPVTFTTPAIRVLTRASGSYLADGVLVGDVVTGPSIPAGTKVAAVTALTVTVDQDIVSSFTDALTFTSNQPQTRDFIRPSLYSWFNRVAVSSTGGMNTIPLNLSGTPGQTFFVVFEFPRTPASADTFPFLFTDRNDMDRGLFANSFVTDTSGVPRAAIGAMTGTPLFIDQNLVVSMTYQISGGPAPMNSPASLGLNLRDASAEYTYRNPDNVLADGEPAPNNNLDHVELVTRGLTWGSAVATGGAGAEKISLPGVPGSGPQIWGVRSLDKSGNRSLVGNVTITGPVAITAYPSVAEDADEANGRANDIEASPVNPPFTDRPETLWPAGDIDNYWFYAQPGQTINVDVAPAGIDFRNDMRLVVNLFDNNGDLVESVIAAGPGSAVHLSHNAAPPSGNSNSKAFKRYFAQVYDRNGSQDDPSGWARVLVPAAYNLAVDVFTSADLDLSDDPQLSGGAPAEDKFAFANAGANPAPGHATFRFVIPKSQGEASVKLRIYDVRGRLISTLVNGSQSAGTHFASWSGHDLRGNRVSSGPYFARIDAGSFRQTVRIVMN